MKIMDFYILIKFIINLFSNYVFEEFIDYQQIMILSLLLYKWKKSVSSFIAIIAQKIQLTQSTLR